MNESTLFLLAFVLVVLAAGFYLAFQFSKKDRWPRVGYVLALLGFAAQTAALAARTVQSRHAPFTNMYESLAFLSWALLLAYLVVEKRFNIQKAGAYLLLIVVALMALASSPLMPKDITPTVPALQSYWLWLHVSVTLIGEAFFAIAFVTSILYLRAAAREKKGRQTKGGMTAESLDSTSYRLVAIGFPLFTLGGLVFGMVWAYKAWGTYWSWDPKEVWSLITWFVFALYLHTRLVMGWKGRRSAAIAIIGFLCALFTYFGVNYLLSGLHSYA